MTVLLLALAFYALGLLATAAGSRLAGRCMTWCSALCGFPMWVVSGTVVPLCVALPQLMLAFLAAGMDATGLAVGVALAGAVTDAGLALGLCLLRRDTVVMREEFFIRCTLLLAAALVMAVFVRDGSLSYTGTGLLMALFVIFMLQSIACQYRYTHEGAPGSLTTAGDASGQTLHATAAFPVMSLPHAMRNLAGVLGGLALLAVGGWALLYSASALAGLTGTIQALWAATLISFGFCLPLLAEVLHHPFGTVWQRFAERCRFYAPATLPMQLLGSAVLSLTLALPLSSLMYRDRLPVGAQFRRYDVPLCLTLALVLLVPPLVRKHLSRWQGAACFGLYLVYVAAVLLAPTAAA